MNVDLGFATLEIFDVDYDHTGGQYLARNTGFYAPKRVLGFYYNYPRPMVVWPCGSYADEANLFRKLRLVSKCRRKHSINVVGGFYRKQQLNRTQESYLRGSQAMVGLPLLRVWLRGRVLGD